MMRATAATTSRGGRNCAQSFPRPALGLGSALQRRAKTAAARASAAHASAARGAAALPLTARRPPSRRQLAHVARAGEQAGVVTSTAAAVTAEPLRVELDTVGARGSIKFDVAPMGFGQAIVTVAVSGGSEAEEAGVRRGMRLTAISDPIRRNEVWKLQDRPSLKNIRELLRMRSADTITLEFVPWDGPLPGGVDGDSIPTSSAGSAMGSALSSVDGSSLSSGESIGDRLARQYREAAATGRSPTAVQQRQQRRRERMELDARRDDRPFLLGVLALFVLPPLVILVVAQSSGYLDALYTNTLIGLR